MKNFGNTMVIWDYHARKPLQTLDVPGAPLEVRWALQPQHDYAFTSTALTSKLWGVFRKPDGTFEAVELADIGNPADVPLPVDISLSADDSTLFVDSFMDGTVRVFDVSSPREPKLILEQKIGAAGEHGLPVLGREAPLLHQLAAGELGRDGDTRTRSSSRCSTGTVRRLKPRFEIDFPGRGAGPAAHHALRPAGLLPRRGSRARTSRSPAETP